MAIDKDFVIKNGLQVNENLIFADPDTDKVGIGTTTANRKLVVIGDGEVSQSLAVGTTITAERIAVTGVSTAQSGLDVGVGGTVLGVSVLNKQIGINSTNPTYTVDLRGPVSTGTTAAFVFGDVEVTGSIKATSLSGQISAGGTVGFTNVTVEKNLVANNAEVFTKFNIDDNSNKFRFIAAGDPPGIGFTQNVDNPTIYLNRGQNYKFVVDAGGFPFYIKTEPTADLLNQFNRGVVNNGAQVGIITFKVPFDAPNLLFYQASNTAGMGGTIFVNNDQLSNSIGILTVTSFFDSNTQADFEQIFVSGIGTINNLKGPDFSVSSGIVTASQTQTAFIGVSTGADKVLIEQKNDSTGYQVLFTDDSSTGYRAGYIDANTGQFKYNPSTQVLTVNEVVGNLSGIATGADNINVDQRGNNVDYQVIFSDTDGSAYQRLYIDTNNANLTYNPSTNTLTSTNVNATTFTGSLSGTATNANNINVDEKNDNTDYQVLFSDNQGNSFQRPYIDSNSGQFKYNPSTNTLTAGNIAGAGDNITNLDGSNISQGTINANRIPDASTTAQGVVQLNTSISSTSTTKAATPSAVKAAYDAAIQVIPTGSVMLFYQSAAPTGWTKLTTNNNKALRVVSGSGGGTGGSNNFTSAFDSSRAVPLLQHNHTANSGNQNSNHSHSANASSSSGGNGAHGHSFSDNHSHNVSGNSNNNGNHTHGTPTGLGDGDGSAFSPVGDGQGGSGSGTNSTSNSAGGHSHNVSGNTNTATVSGNTGNQSNHSHNVNTNVSLGNNNSNHSHSITVSNNGSSGASMDFAVKYIDVIICSKD
tara:strand:- start:8061 stop:10496 length:2436 start_codon:yes stop_codon:yes gene_type:complete